MYWEQMVYAPNQKILLKSEAPTSSWSKTPPNFTDSEEKMGSVAKKSAERLAPRLIFTHLLNIPTLPNGNLPSGNLPNGEVLLFRRFGNSLFQIRNPRFPFLSQ